MDGLVAGCCEGRLCFEHLGFLVVTVAFSLPQLFEFLGEEFPWR